MIDILKKKSIINFISVLLLLIGFYVFVNRLISYFLPFILGYIIAVIIEPIVKILNKYLKLTRNISCIVSILVFVFSVGWLGTILFTKLIKEFKSLVVKLPLYQDNVLDLLIELSLKIDKLSGKIEGSTQKLIEQNWVEITSKVTDKIGPELTSETFNFFTTLPRILFIIIITIIAAYFISKDRYRIRVFISKQIPIKWRDNYNLIRKAMVDAFFGYIKAQLTIMMFISIICIIGLMIISNQYALLIGVCIGILDAIPVFGSGTILIPWALYKALTSDLYYALALGIIYTICVLMRQFLEPKLIGDNIGIHPLLTLMSIYIGLKAFGVFGFILGPLVLIFIKTMQKMEVIPQWKT